MIPSSGQINVLNAASTRAGLASQIMNSPSRGKSPPKMANRQPILLTPYLVLQCPPRGGYWRLAYHQPALTDARNPSILSILNPGTFVRFSHRVFSSLFLPILLS